MNGITHKQAIQLIYRRQDGLLKGNQEALLDEHLRSCDSCRSFSDEITLLAANLNREFKARWDENPVPSKNISSNVLAKAKNIPAGRRTSVNLQLLVGAMALIVLAFVINFAISRLQNASTASNNGTPTDGDFTFDFWLYCNPALKPDDPEHYSAVAGVGIYSSWRYTGPQVEGPVRYYFIILHLSQMRL